MPVPNDPALQAVIDGMAAKVTRITGVADSATTLLGSLAAEFQTRLDLAESLGASVEELAGLQALADTMDASATTLAAAVAANTPGAR